MVKTSFGIRIDGEILQKLDDIVAESRYLGISRSEVIEAILKDYFRSNENPRETRRLIIQKREGRL
jgi:metal-responsive CopG/Arc/MetJ family transcriptional regulator